MPHNHSLGTEMSNQRPTAGWLVTHACTPSRHACLYLLGHRCSRFYHIATLRIITPCCSCVNGGPLSCSSWLSFVLAEYLRGNVLPVEQHVASDLPRILHPDSHLKALTELRHKHTLRKYISFPDNKTGTSFQFLLFFKDTFTYSRVSHFSRDNLIKALTVKMLKEV